MTKYIALIFFCSTIGCVNKDSVPSGIIPKTEMQKVLWDMIQADQFSKQFLVKDSAKKRVSFETMKLYDQVFQIHHITKDQFQKSYQFYISRPDILKILFDSLSAQGNRRLQEVYQSPLLPKKSK
jgi:hypothetical protein